MFDFNDKNKMFTYINGVDLMGVGCHIKTSEIVEQYTFRVNILPFAIEAAFTDEAHVRFIV